MANNLWCFKIFFQGPPKNVVIFLTKFFWGPSAKMLWYFIWGAFDQRLWSFFFWVSFLTFWPRILNFWKTFSSKNVDCKFYSEDVLIKTVKNTRIIWKKNSMKLLTQKIEFLRIFFFFGPTNHIFFRELPYKNLAFFNDFLKKKNRKYRI